MASGVAARAVYWHTIGVTVVDEQTLMPIGVMVGVGTTLVLAGWAAGRLVKGFQDRLDNLDKRLNDLYCMRSDECKNPKEKKK